jgi:zinc transporter 1/2/3
MPEVGLMDLFQAKLVMLVGIFLAGIAGGSVPRVIGARKRGQTLLRLGSGLAGGIFLGTGIIHLLGDSHAYFAATTDGSEYPLFLVIGGIGFLLILLLEKVLVRAEEASAATSSHPYVLMAVLSLHSIIAGAALGLEGELADAVILLVAILVHKSFAAFALGISFVDSGLGRGRYFSLISLFSIMTPIGVLLGAVLKGGLLTETSVEFEAIFDGLAGGTFIYVATMDIIRHEFDERGMRWAKFAAVAFGFGLMAFLARWS